MQRLKNLGTGAHILGVLDQILVSGTSFLMTVAVGRWTNAGELGIYAIAMSVVAAATSLQDALIVKPFTIQRFSSIVPKAEHVGSSLILSIIFGLLLGLLVGVGGLASHFGTNINNPMIAFAVACMIPFVMMREFVRKIAIANLQMASALGLDIASSCASLIILSMLALSGSISSTTICFSVACVSFVITLTWFVRTNKTINFSRKSLAITATQDWQLGKWLFVGQLLREIQQSAPYWIVLFIAGAASTGLYAACMSIVAFSNPIIYGIANVLTPNSVIAWNEFGGEALRKQSYRNILLLGSLMAAFCIVVGLLGTTLINSLFHGFDFLGSTQMLMVLALGMAASTLGLPASIGLATMQRPRAIVATGGFSAGLSIFLVVVLMFLWGTIGVAYGVLIGNAVGSLTRWIAFLKIVPDKNTGHEVLNIIQASGLVDKNSNLRFNRVGEGDDAVVYSVSDENYDSSLIVKVFKSNSVIAVDGMEAQFEALNKLHKGVGEVSHGGWTIATPQPLYSSACPLAIVMTLVPGRNMQNADSNLGNHSASVWLEVADTCERAVAKLWLGDKIHGDFGLQNLLVDFDQRKLSLIDPGTVESCRICTHRGNGSPAVFELGHLLADYATDAASIFGNSSAIDGRQIFTERLIELTLLAAQSTASKRKLLSDIQKCCAEHIVEKLDKASRIRRQCLRLIKRSNEKRVAQMLMRLADTRHLRKPASSHSAAE